MYEQSNEAEWKAKKVGQAQLSNENGLKTSPQLTMQRKEAS